jgi:hypothetical protein
MLAHSLHQESFEWFAGLTELLNRMIGKLTAKENTVMTSSELEKFIHEQVQKIGREAMEAKLNMMGSLQPEAAVIGSDGVERRRKKLLERTVSTEFGNVTFKRWGYSTGKGDSLFPADGHLNLAPVKYTLGVERIVSEDVSRVSYDDALEVLSQRTEMTVPKRQALELANRAATDFVDFYDTQAAKPADSPPATSSQLIMSTDGKGVVMRPEGLRDATRKASEKAQNKLKKRLSPGEKKDRKRMAQVASVYTIAPHIRTAEEIAGCQPTIAAAKEKQKPPKPENKRVWASLEREPEQVLREMFEEARTRDPRKEKTWAALVDGNEKQLRLLDEEATAFGVALTVIIDIIHVLEYLWKASHALYKQGDPRGEQFVSDRLLRLLNGQSSQVAKGMRKMATDRGLTKVQRKAVDKCASYLQKYEDYLHYDEYLAKGLPIATGVIEGACRYLVKDRMDITGARWGLPGAEAVLKLRSIRVSGDLDAYWSYHEKKEQERNHSSKYENGLPPLRDQEAQVIRPKGGGKLRLVKG